MSYSANFTVGSKGSGKVRYFGAKQEVYHACRDLQKKKNVKLKSESIRPELTRFNQTYLKTQTGWQKPKNMQDVFNEMDRRFNGVVGSKRKDGTFNSVRKDAVAMREVVMSLGNTDSDYYAKYGDDVDKMAHDPSFKVMRDWADQQFGDHILYFSIHVDEGRDHAHHAHVHMGLDTITETDGVKHFNQRILKSISSPKALKMAHKGFYKYLQGQGLDVSLDPAKTAKTRERLSQADYNALKQSQSKLKQMDEREASLNDRENDLDDWQADLLDAQADIKQKHEKLIKQSRQEARAIADRQAQVEEQEEQARRALADAQRLKKELEERLRKFKQAIKETINHANSILKSFKSKADQERLMKSAEGQAVQQSIDQMKKTSEDWHVQGIPDAPKAKPDNSYDDFDF